MSWTRIWTALLIVFVSPLVVAAKPPAPEGSKPTTLWVYVGTYTGGPSKGIYRLELDLATGKLSPPTLAGEAVNPSFLAIHPGHRFLYAVNEIDSLRGKKGGAVSAYAIEPTTGKLTLLNQQSSGGGGTCYVVVDRQGKHALAANYGGGSVCVLPIQADGRLGEATAFVQHKGTGPDKQRQEAPHAHSINLDRANRFALVADLGLDKILVYRYDTAKGTLTPNDPPAATLAPGSGPRHLAFHPDGKHAYVINEMACTVTAFDYDSDKGTLKTIQTITTLPDGLKKGYSTAEVVVHPSGKFLYGSNRGQDSIAIFTIDMATGKLTAAGHQGYKIKTPRNFAIDPTGTYLLAANQDGNSIVVFRVDPQTGGLTPTGSVVPVPRPVCVRFMPAGK
jgi:6-phosphogluconolactonase